MKLALVFALAATTALSAQTQPQPQTPVKKPSTTTRPAGAAKVHTTTAKPATPDIPNIPHVDGTPQPLYALKYIDITVGDGPVAEPRKWYTVKYTGWLTDGTKFDSSYDHPDPPFAFPYGARRVIPGWDTGFDGMHVGGKRRLFIPWQLAYGEGGRGPIPPKADLIFDIEFVAMTDTEPTAPAPVDAQQQQPASSAQPASSNQQPK